MLGVVLGLGGAARFSPPVLAARTILLSVISLLNEPNTFSPANVDASVMYRKWKESKGKDREYTDIIRCVEGSLSCHGVGLRTWARSRRCAGTAGAVLWDWRGKGAPRAWGAPSPGCVTFQPG